MQDVREALKAQRAANSGQSLPAATQVELLGRPNGNEEFQAMMQLWNDLLKANPAAVLYNPFFDAGLQVEEANSQQVCMHIL